MRGYIGYQRALGFLVLGGLAACGGLAPSTWFNQSNLTPSGAITATPTPTPKATPQAKKRHGVRRATRRPPAEQTPEEAEQKELGNATPASQTTPAAPMLQLTPSSTPAQATADKDRARQLIEEAANKLGVLDRSKMGALQAADYDRVRSMVRSARDAFDHQDYLAAEGLARKASLLGSRLAGQRPVE